MLSLSYFLKKCQKIYFDFFFTFNDKCSMSPQCMIKKNENLRNKETLRGNNWLKKTSDLFGVRMKESLIEI